MSQNRKFLMYANQTKIKILILTESKFYDFPILVTRPDNLSCVSKDLESTHFLIFKYLFPTPIKAVKRIIISRKPSLMVL